MIVDDQDILRMVLKQSLEKSGEIQVVSECSNGFEAVEACKISKPDVILMDISMPVMDGIAATKEIKALYKDISIIMLTTPNNEDSLKMAMEEGANGFIFKNAKTNELIDIINNISNATTRKISQMSAQEKNTKSSNFIINGKEVELSQIEFKIITMIKNGEDLESISKELAMAKERTKKKIDEILKNFALATQKDLALFASKNNLG